MGVGVFVGVTATDGVDPGVQDLVDRTLRANGLPVHTEPAGVPGGGPLGRAATDHVPGGWLSDFVLTELDSEEDRTHLGCLDRPGGAIYVPRPLDRPLAIEGARGWLASSAGLLEELRSAADGLAIPGFDGELPDAVARAIADDQPLFDGDDAAAWAEQRSVWLCLYEGARISVARGSLLWIGEPP